MRLLLRAGACFIPLVIALSTTPASARDDQPRCASAEAEQYDIVQTVSPRLALNNYDGVGQKVAEIGFSHSQCIGQTSSRWLIDGIVSHVSDDYRQHSNTVLMGGGIILYPRRGDGSFSVAPSVHLGYERIGQRSDNFVFDVAVGVEKDVMLVHREDIAQDGSPFTVPTSLLLINLRAGYTDRRSTDASGSSFRASMATATLYGALGLDQAVGARTNPWRIRLEGGYRRFSQGSIDGFASFIVSARPVDSRHENYHWNFGAQFNVGDGGYRGVLFSLSYRLARARRR